MNVGWPGSAIRPAAIPSMSTENTAHAAAKVTAAAKPTPPRDAALAGAAAFASRFPHVLCLDDFEDAARRHLPRPIFGYVAGAVETNSSLEDNRDRVPGIRLRAQGAGRRFQALAADDSFRQDVRVALRVLADGYHRLVRLSRRPRDGACRRRSQHPDDHERILADPARGGGANSRRGPGSRRTCPATSRASPH